MALARPFKEDRRPASFSCHGYFNTTASAFLVFILKLVLGKQSKERKTKREIRIFTFARVGVQTESEHSLRWLDQLLVEWSTSEFT